MNQLDAVEESVFLPDEDVPFEDPQGELELAIAAVWRVVLQQERIGRHDNFFGLGGDSVVGMQLVAKLGTELRVSLPLVCLFSNPTVRGLAQLISTAG